MARQTFPSLHFRRIISSSRSPQPRPSKAQQPAVMRHVINHTHVSYARWNLRFNTSHGKWRRFASWLQYKYILRDNVSFFCLWISISRIRRGGFPKCCANYSPADRLLKVREEPRREREAEKVSPPQKKKSNLVGYLWWPQVKENIQRMLATRKRAWILISKKKKLRKKKIGPREDAGEVVNVCQWKTLTSNNTGLIKVMTHSLCPPPAQTAGQLTKGGRGEKKKKSLLANTDTQRTDAAVSPHKSAKGHWSIEQPLTIYFFFFI